MAGLKQVSLDPIRVGDSKTITVSIRDAITNAVVDITGDKFYFTAKDFNGQDDSEAAVQVSSVAPSGANSEAGVAVITIPASATVNITPGSYFYDLTWLSTVSEPDGRHPVQQGTVSFILPITQATS
jgi:hypothetical protein